MHPCTEKMAVGHFELKLIEHVLFQSTLLPFFFSTKTHGDADAHDMEGCCSALIFTLHADCSDMLDFQAPCMCIGALRAGIFRGCLESKKVEDVHCSNGLTASE